MSASVAAQKPVPRRRVELLLLGLLALFWGSSYLLVKIGLESIPPLTLIALRVSLAAAILVAVMRWQGYQFPTDASTWRQLAVQSLLNSFGAWSLLAWGQQYIDSGLAGVLNSTSPIFVFFITLLFTRHEAVNGRKLAGALLGVLGVTLIVGLEVLQGLGQQVIAQLAVTFAAGMYACAAIYGKRFAHLPAPVTAASVLLCATVVMLPVSVLVEQPWSVRPDARSIVAVFLLATFCTAGALMLYFRLVRTLGSMGVASQGFLRSGVSVILGIVVLGETVTSTLAAGIVAAIVGVALINWPARTRPARCATKTD